MTTGVPSICNCSLCRAFYVIGWVAIDRCFLNLNFPKRILNLSQSLAVLLDQLHLFELEDFVGVCLFVYLLFLTAVGLLKCRYALMQLKLVDLLLEFQLFSFLKLLFLLLLKLTQFDANFLFEGLPPGVLG